MPGPQRHADRMSRSSSGPKPHLGTRRGVCVVVDNDRDPQTLREHGLQRFAAPGEVRREPDRSLTVDKACRPGTHCVDVEGLAQFVNQLDDRLLHVLGRQAAMGCLTTRRGPHCCPPHRPLRTAPSCRRYLHPLRFAAYRQLCTTRSGYFFRIDSRRPMGPLASAYQRRRGDGHARTRAIWGTSARRLERGASAVEFALISLPLMTLMLGMLQYGWYFFSAQSASSAARESARRLVVGDCQTGSHCRDLRSQPGKPDFPHSDVRFARRNDDHAGKRQQTELSPLSVPPCA